MKQARVQQSTGRPDQQLTLLTAAAKAADQRARGAAKKARLAKNKLKAARKAYKHAKKSLKNATKLTKQAHKELAKWQEQADKQRKRGNPESVAAKKHPPVVRKKPVTRAPKKQLALVNEPALASAAVATPTATPAPTELAGDRDHREDSPTDPTPSATTPGPSA